MFMEANKQLYLLINLIIIEQSCVQYMKIMVVILALLLELSLQLTTVLQNTYLADLRIQNFLFPTNSASTGITVSEVNKTYESPISQSFTYQCYAFISSYQCAVNRDGQLYNQVSIVNCISTSTTIRLWSNGPTKNWVTYMVVSNKMLASPNFIVLQLSGPTSNRLQILNSLNTTGKTSYCSFIRGFDFPVASSVSQPEYGFEFIVNSISSAQLNYSISFRIAADCPSCVLYFTVILLNQDYFNVNDKNLVWVASKSLKFTNLTQNTYKNQLYNNASGSGLVVIGGTNGFYFKSGDRKAVFYFEQKQNGEISINTTIATNQLVLNYITFPLTHTVTQPDPSESNLKIPLIVAGVATLVLIIILFACCRRKKNPYQQPKSKSDPIDHSLAVTAQKIQSNDSTPAIQIIQKQSPKQQPIKPKICSICQGDRVQVKSHCGDFFHFKCLKELLSMCQECPICNKSLKSAKYKKLCSRCQVEEQSNEIIQNCEINEDVICWQCNMSKLKSEINVFESNFKVIYSDVQRTDKIT